MENEPLNTTPNLSTATPPKKRRLLRVGLMLVACGLTAGFVTLMISREKARAQLQQARAEESRLLATHISDTVKARTDHIAEYLNQTAALPQTVPAPAQITRYVPITTTNQTTGEIITQMVPVTSTDSLAHNNNLPSDAHRSVDAEILQLAKKARNAPPEQRKTLVENITKKLDDIFEARHREQASKIKQLTEELQQSQALLDRRKELKGKIIERRLKELIGEPDELNWNPPPLKQTSSSKDPSYNPTLAYPNLPNPTHPAPIQPLEPNPAAAQPLPPQTLQPQTLQPQASYPGPLPLPELAPVAGSASPTGADVGVPLVQPIDPTIPISASLGEFSRAPNGALDPVTLESSLTPVAPYVPGTQLNEPSSLPFPTLADNQPAPISSSPAPSTTTEKAETKTSIANTKKEDVSQSEPSFLHLGLKIKKLSAAQDKAKSDDEIKRIDEEFEEVRELWEFEKKRIQSELTQTNAELAIVKRQLEICEEDFGRLKELFQKGSVGKSELSEIELKKTNVELQVSAIQSKLTKLRQAMDWMTKLEGDTFGKKAATE